MQDMQVEELSTVELFAGTGSFSKVAQSRGHSVFRVELDTQHEAELHKDILELQRSDLPKRIDVLWMSPPCTTFSVASLRHYWVKGKPRNAKTWHGISMMLKSLQLIKEIQADNPGLIWYLENPRGMLRKQWFMQGLRRHTISYCQYGDHRQKPTDIWTNDSTWSPRPICKRGRSCHNSQPRGYFAKKSRNVIKLGTQGLHGAKERSIIPPDLFIEIFNSLKIDRSANGLIGWMP